MELSPKEIERLAKLARLDLSPEEKKQFAGELTDILSFVEQLKEVEVGNTEPVKQISGLAHVMRPDEASYTFPREEMLESAAKKTEDSIEVPQVIKK